MAVELIGKRAESGNREHPTEKKEDEDNGKAHHSWSEARTDWLRARTARLKAEVQLMEDMGSLIRAQAESEEIAASLAQLKLKHEQALIEERRAEIKSEIMRNTARNTNQSTKMEGRTERNGAQAHRNSRQAAPPSRTPPQADRFRNPVKGAEALKELKSETTDVAVPPTK